MEESLLLDTVALRYPTDKSSRHHNYTKYYQEVLGPRRAAIRGLLEIGVGLWHDNVADYGPSLRMWRDWLPNARIVGMDIKPADGIDFGERIAYINSDQCSQKGLNQALAMLDNHVDVIIDDASHINRLTIATFEFLFLRLAPGGVYFIEDTTGANDSRRFPGNSSRELEDLIINLWRSLHFYYRSVSTGNCADFYKSNMDVTMTVYERWVERVDLTRGIIAVYKRAK